MEKQSELSPTSEDTLSEPVNAFASVNQCSSPFSAFKIPAVPKLANELKTDDFEFVSGNNFLFDLRRESFPHTGRPSLFDDGRESLGILPQFKANLNSVSKMPETLEDPETFLLSPSYRFNENGDDFLSPLSQLKGCVSPSNVLLELNDDEMNRNKGEGDCLHPLFPRKSILVEDNRRDSFEMLTKHYNDLKELTFNMKLSENLDVSKQDDNFLKTCQALEDGIFKEEHNTSNDNLVLIEASYIASKLADNSLLETSQEGAGEILDMTPQPEFIEMEDSLNISDRFLDTETVHKQVDIMLPPKVEQINPIAQCSGSQPNNRNPIELLFESGSKNITDLLGVIQMLRNHQENRKIRNVLDNAIKELAELSDTDESGNQRPLSAGEQDSGNSSTDNARACNQSMRALSSDQAKVLDSTLDKSAPCRLSITFSHKDDPHLPKHQTSNNLKQQTMHMRKLWTSGVSSTTDASAQSSDISKASSTSSMASKWKPKKADPEPVRKGPLKAVVPLTSLNTSLTLAQVAGPAFAGKGLPKPRQITPRGNPRPVAQSTPEEYSSTFGSRRSNFVSSPLARPVPENRTKRDSAMSKAESMSALPATNSNASKTGECKVGSNLIRGKSLGHLQPSSKSKTLRRSQTADGKENSSGMKNVKRNYVPRTGKVPAYGGCVIKPLNLMEKMRQIKQRAESNNKN